MERVKKGYINIASLWGESRLGVYSVEFSSFAELENTLHKIELVLKGAEVIEMPNDTGIYNQSLLADIPINADANDAYRKGAMDMANWLKSKIVK